MKTRSVWQCDADGYLIGRATADESPLEPNLYLIPAGAVDVKPPHPLPDGRQWRWDGRAWAAVPARPPVRVLSPEERLAAFLRDNPDIKQMIGS